MICADTSSFVAFLQGESGPDVLTLANALAQRNVVLSPVSLTELLSGPLLSSETRRLLANLPLLAITSGYWERAGELRASLLRQGLRARIADSLITQSCLDHDVPLITRDRDFQGFRKYARLKLL